MLMLWHNFKVRRMKLLSTLREWIIDCSQISHYYRMIIYFAFASLIKESSGFFTDITPVKSSMFSFCYPQHYIGWRCEHVSLWLKPTQPGALLNQPSNIPCVCWEAADGEGGERRVRRRRGTKCVTVNKHTNAHTHRVIHTDNANLTEWQIEHEINKTQLLSWISSESGTNWVPTAN